MLVDMDLGYIDCFKIQIKFWAFLGILPNNHSHYYKYYSRIFIFVFVILYFILYTLNFYFMPRQLDSLIDEMFFYFTDVSVFSKVMTFIFNGKKIAKILDTFRNEIFWADDEESTKILDDAKVFIIRFMKINTTVSMTSSLTHAVVPFYMHIFLGTPLQLPISSYSFLPVEILNRFFYPLYLYQIIGMHIHMHYNLHVDSFFLGLMILSMAHLKILDAKLRNVTCYDETTVVEPRDLTDKESILEIALNKCIIRYDKISKFCKMYLEAFSATLFVQFCMASCIICMCLVRFNMPAMFGNYLFLSAYMTVMTVQIMVPCWLGSQIIVASSSLSTAVYSCDWIMRSRRFKSSLRLFVERVQKPLSIIGGKMFPLSLQTFTSIMNSAYSFFTLLRHMQSQDS